MKTNISFLTLGILALGVSNCMPPSASPTPCVGNCGSSSSSSSTSSSSTSSSTSSSSGQAAINIAAYAKITASGFNTKGASYYPVHVKDGQIGSGGWNSDVTWALNNDQDENWYVEKTDLDHAWLKLEWATPVSITSVNLFDHPTGNNITSGALEYVDADGVLIKQVTFGSLPNSGTQALAVSGPGTDKKVKSMKIKFLSHTGDHIGLNEVEVLGYRIQDDSKKVTAGTDLAQYSKVVDALSVKDQLPSYATPNSTATSSFAGYYSARYPIAGPFGHYWRSNYGTNSYIILGFDLPMCIKSVILMDASFFGGMGKIKHAKVIINDDNTNVYQQSKPENDASMIVTLDPTKTTDVKTVKILLDDTTGGDIGINYIAVMACKDE